MPFFGQVQQDFREKRKLLGVHAQLAGSGAEQVAFDADDIAEIEHLVELVFVLGNRVLADVHLQSLAGLHQVHESGLAHAADGLDAAGDADLGFIGELFRGFGRVRCENLRNGVREIESLAVGAEAERLDFRDAAQALR